MDVCAAFVADGEPSVAIEPRECALHDPAVTAQPLAGVDHAARNASLDPAPAQVSSAEGVVAGFVGVEFFGSAPWTTFGTADWRNGLKHFLKEKTVVPVGG